MITGYRDDGKTILDTDKGRVCVEQNIRRTRVFRFLSGSISYPIARKENCMNSKPKLVLIKISSILMLLVAMPMFLWCLQLIDNAALDYTYAGAGCFAAGIAYVFSMITVITGLAFAGRLHRHCWCRMLGYIQLAAVVLLIVPLHSYTALTLPPLFLLTVLYLFGVGWREKLDCEQQ